MCGGYDINFVLNGKGLKHCATAFSDKSKIKLDVYTTMPGVQLYTSNFIDHEKGKHGFYEKRQAFCLETQNFPNAINCDGYPSPILYKNENWSSKTVYAFSSVNDGESVISSAPEKQFEITVDDEYFDRILSGEKTVEVRLYDDKRQLFNIGDSLVIRKKSNQNKAVCTSITDMKWFVSFADLFATPLLKKCGLDTNKKSIATEIMRKFYDENDEKTYGVVAIEFEIK